MHSESLALLVSFWSWVSAVIGVVLLGLLLPALIGAVVGFVPLMVTRKDWRGIPMFAAVAVMFIAAGCLAFAQVRAGMPALDFWVGLSLSVGALTFVVMTASTLDLSIRRIRRARSAMDAMIEIRSQPQEIRDAQRPGSRARMNAIEAEYYVAEWMRWLGATDSIVTPTRRDGGVDVRSSRFVAQVKHRPNEYVPVDVVRALHGVAVTEGRAGLVFTSGQFSRAGLEFAAQADVALFIFRPSEGKLAAANANAQRLITNGMTMDDARSEAALRTRN